MTYRLTRLIPLLALPLVACMADSSELGTSSEALSHEGPWDIPADTLAIGDSQSVEYTGAGPWRGTSGCHGDWTPGALTMRDWLYAAFPQIEHIGGYSCRAINGDSSTMSVHATGRALDIHIPLHDGAADNDLGDPVGNYLIEHAQDMGIQYVIWDRWTWGAHRAAGSKERSYGGAHPHHDHLHVELSVEAGREATPWFSGAMPLPDQNCPAFGAEGGVVDDTSDCFAAYGPAAYWRSASGGHAGGLLWTNAFESSSPSNWARWHVSVTEPGDYVVEAYAPAEYAVHTATRYQVRHAGEDHSMEVNLAGADGWVMLGTFTFDGVGAEHISVYDNSSVAVGEDQHVPADAIRLTPVGVEPGPGPEPQPGPRTERLWTTVHAELPPVTGGDPMIDDDPMGADPIDGRPRPDTLVGTCSVSMPGSGQGGLALLALLPLALVLRRR